MFEPPIFVVDRCEAETTVADFGPILLHWPVSNIGDTVRFQWDACEDLTALGGNAILRNASRSCAGTFPTEAIWEEIIFTTENDFVFTFTTRRLCDVATVSDQSKSLDTLAIATLPPFCCNIDLIPPNFMLFVFQIYGDFLRGPKGHGKRAQLSNILDLKILDETLLSVGD